MSYKLIQITNTDLMAKVDVEDYERLNKYKWYAVTTRKSDKYLTAVRYETKMIGKPKTIRMHRELLDAKSGTIVDHVNHDTLDNRKNNLRICTHKENMMNQRKPENNSSGFRGVNKEKGVWRARIYKNKEKISLGVFKNIFDAAFARKEAETLYHGEFACYF